VRNARQDFLPHTSTRLVRSADTIAIEDLNIRAMVRNKHLARAISDASWGEFRRQLEYKPPRRTPTGGHRPLASVVEDVLMLRTCGGRVEAVGSGMDLPGVPNPTRPGYQRGEEHSGGRSCRVCLWS
jgi:IS605 OrfB family transposase